MVTQVPHVPANLSDHQRMHAELMQQNQALVRELRDLVSHFAPDRKHQTIIFNSKPWELQYKGHHHAYLLLSAAATLTLNFPGMMSVSLSFVPGYNDFNYPEGTQFTAASQVVGSLRLTNETMDAPVAGLGSSSVTQGTSPWVTQVSNANPNGANTSANSSPTVTATDDKNVTPGTQGWIAATGTGTAGQDDAIAFASAVRIVVLYNASANPVPLEFDQASLATSFPLQPGQYMIVDHVYVTAVHVFPSALLPINAANGLYVKGWV